MNQSFYCSSNPFHFIGKAPQATLNLNLLQQRLVKASIFFSGRDVSIFSRSLAVMLI